jgi:hypothetical protein
VSHPNPNGIVDGVENGSPDMPHGCLANPFGPVWPVHARHLYDDDFQVSVDGKFTEVEPRRQ